MRGRQKVNLRGGTLEDKHRFSEAQFIRFGVTALLLCLLLLFLFLSFLLLHGLATEVGQD